MKGPLIYYEIKDMYGSDLSSTKLAAELRKSILDEIDLGFNVEVDFKDVRTVTTGWSRNVFGVIVKEKGEDFFKNHILVSNMSKFVRKSVLEGIGEMLEV
jgi:cell division GTPase FtsZ